MAQVGLAVVQRQRFRREHVLAHGRVVQRILATIVEHKHGQAAINPNRGVAFLVVKHDPATETAFRDLTLPVQHIVGPNFDDVGRVGRFVLALRPQGTVLKCKGRAARRAEHENYQQQKDVGAVVTHGLVLVLRRNIGGRRNGIGARLVGSRRSRMILTRRRWILSMHCRQRAHLVGRRGCMAYLMTVDRR